MADNQSELEYMKELYERFNGKDGQVELTKAFEKSASEANIDLIVAICQQEKTK